MYSLSIKETYQRGMSTRIKNNGEVSAMCRSLEELNDKIKSLNKDLYKMNVMDVETHPHMIKVRFFKPNKVGLFTRIIQSNSYNPPAKKEEFSFI